MLNWHSCQIDYPRELNFLLLYYYNFLRMNRRNLTKVCICIAIDRIKFGVSTNRFSQICYRVMALDWCRNFDS